jgi:hypothetical protein
MDPFTIALLGGGLFGLGKTAYDSAGRSSDKEVQAATTRYSPWTGMKGAQPREVDPFGNVLKGGLSGAMLANIGTNAGWFGGGAATAGAAGAGGANLGVDTSLAGVGAENPTWSAMMAKYGKMGGYGLGG